MTTTRRQKTALALVAGLSLAGTLTGCAVEEAAIAETEPTAEATATAEATQPAAPAPNAAGGSYQDGTYTETGSYQSPNGTESVEVTLTLADDVITAVTVVSMADDPQSKSFQSQFIGGIEAAVVGKKLDSISVSRVAGSSLTSGGFNAAVESIKADAA